MTSTLNNSYPLSEITSSGHIVTLSVLYDNSQKTGIWVLVGAAGSSLLAVLLLLTVLAISAYKTMRTPSEHRFMRTHVVAYFISLLLCDAISAVGSLMNAYWINRGGVFLGAFCTSQGVLKNTGNIGTALWSMVIAIHTFFLLFLKRRPRDYTLYATLLVVWTFMGIVVVVGPTAVQNLKSKGPYFGVSGYWCWITDGYATERVTLEYFWMFLSALVSFLLYTVVCLSLRGNIVISGGKLRLCFKCPSSVWESQLGRSSPDGQVTSLAKQMLAYPIAYSALILPISVCRFLQWTGHEIPFGVTVFADAVFLLSGLVNAILFTTTRKIVPTHRTLGLFSRSKSSISDVESQKTISPFLMPYVPAEKAIVSPIEGDQEVPVVSVAVPAPILQKPPSSRTRGSKRGVSLTPTAVSVYSQSSGESHSVLPRIPLSRSQVKSIRKAARKFSLRKPPADVPVEAIEWSDVEVDESFYGSSLRSQNPLIHSPPLPPIPQSAQLSHSRSTSSLTLSQRSQALGNRF